MFGKQFLKVWESSRGLHHAASIASGSGRSFLCGRKSSAVTMVFKSNSTQPESADDLKFEIVKDGKRLSGAQFFETVKSLVAKEDEENFAIPRSAFEVLLAEYDKLQEEGQDWKEKYQRSLAETENVRRRGMKQTEDAKVFAIQGFCKDLLEVADILDLAVNSVKEEELQADKSLKNLHDGIVMTKTVMSKTFSRHGLVSINPEGEKFDPNLHEAVFQMPAAQAKVPPGHVAHVAKIGYCLKERPIRAAQVGVVVE